VATPFERHDPTREPAFGSICPDIYAGTAGIALFLAELYAETGGEHYRTTSRGAIAQALAMMDTPDPTAGAGLYTGWPGIVVAAARISRLIGDEDLVRAARIWFIERSAGAGHDSEPDLLSGTAGTLVASLILWREAEDERLLVHAIRCGDHLCAMAKRRGDALCWPIMTQSGRRALTGFAHGAAGIAFALLELFDATDDERFRVAAEGAFAFERRNFHPGLRNWLDLRYPVEGSRFGPAALVSSVWCHGSAGIAISRLTAWKILRERVYLDEAETAIAASSAWLESRLTLPDKPWSLCHGLPGNADILLWAAESLPEQALTLRWLARRVAGAGIEALARANESGEPLSTDEPGLMLGVAGIGHFYLRLANPTIHSILIPSAASFAPQPQG
jgi:lantibiotic modifying enzyme